MLQILTLEQKTLLSLLILLCVLTAPPGRRPGKHISSSAKKIRFSGSSDPHCSKTANIATALSNSVIQEHLTISPSDCFQNSLPVQATVSSSAALSQASHDANDIADVSAGLQNVNSFPTMNVQVIPPGELQSYQML